MAMQHIAWGILVALLWGGAFVFARIGLDALPPLLFASLRFALVASVAFFVARPALPWPVLAALGLTLGVAQFGLLFLGMAEGVSPGIASFLLHNQTFFTIGLGYCFLSERLKAGQLAGIGVGAVGLALLIMSREGQAAIPGVLGVLGGALAGAIGTILLKRSGGGSMLAVVIWSGLFAPVPLFLLSLLFEGPARIQAGLEAANWATVLAVLYAAIPSTIVAYAIWGRLFQLYSASQVVPFFLLVPVCALALSAVFLGQAVTLAEGVACTLILLGLVCAVLPPRRKLAAAPS